MNFFIDLNDGWLMQSSQKISVHGETISTTKFIPENWFTVSIPTTVVNGLIQNRKFNNPYLSTNLRSLPGYKKHVTTQNFESHYKPDDSPFRTSWWFRKEFQLNSQSNTSPRQIWIKFNGINYAANIWINGNKIAGSDFVIGAYRIFEFNITNYVKESDINIVALEVFSPNPDDLSISFVDWCPLPPDDNMGLWQPVFLYSTGKVKLADPFVSSRVNTTINEAELTISLNLINTQKDSLNVTLIGSLGVQHFKKSILLNPYENKRIILTSNEIPELNIKKPELWWPYQLGNPKLHELILSVKVKEHISDEITIKFGIRDLKTKINEYGSLQFAINGKDILLRGAAWTPDMMLKQSEQDDLAAINYIKNLNMNVIRLEGKLATDNFWKLCDREGILVLAGWVCCSHWEKWKNWKLGDFIIAKESLKSQLLRLRNHPSLINWLYGSDFPPPEKVEKIYLDVLEEFYENLPKISSASATPSEVTGETGVKMTGPYSYVPPSYWYDERRPGVAIGFNTETGPDSCIPPLESIKKMFKENERIIGGETWNFHAGLGAFTHTKLIEETISKRFDISPLDLKWFVKAAQVLAYESWRAMYEAHARNFPKATGIIGWMLNSPWPSLIWQLYDYYYNPNGAFFGSKKGCEPVHIQYSYDDKSISIINFTPRKIKDSTAYINGYDFESKGIFSHEIQINMDRHSLMKIWEVPEIPFSDIYFINLILKDNSKNIMSENFYWLSKTDDIFEDKDEWFYTPLKQHADMKKLKRLPRATIEFDHKINRGDDGLKIQVLLKNTSNMISFFNRIYIFDKSTNEFVTPVYWEDNCISLAPREHRSIEALYYNTNSLEDIIIMVDTWNS